MKRTVQIVFRNIRRAFCAVRRHDLFLQFEPRRLSLRCVDCGWESPGWTLDQPRAIDRPMPAMARWWRTASRTLDHLDAAA